MFATLSVAVVAASLLLFGTRMFGGQSEDGFDIAQIGIGVTAEATTDGQAAPGTTDTSASASSGPSAMIANQPAVPEQTTNQPSPSAGATTTAKATASTKAATTTVTTQTGNSGVESQVVDLVNAERAEAGCSIVVTLDSRLTAAARGHSSDMATRDYFSHDTLGGGGFADRITAQGYSWSTAGENIAMGQATAAQVMEDWMNSAGHKANILNCSFKNIGVGLAYNSSKTPYWTQDFGTLS